MTNPPMIQALRHWSVSTLSHYQPNIVRSESNRKCIASTQDQRRDRPQRWPQISMPRTFPHANNLGIARRIRRVTPSVSNTYSLFFLNPRLIV